MITGKLIWDISHVADRSETRFEFPHLVRFKGNWYCAFREGEIHGGHPTGRGRVIRSADGDHWESVAVFEWDGADVREPRLSITAENWLMVNTSINFVSREPREDGNYYQLEERGTPGSDAEELVARQSVTWLSRDGEHWSSAYSCPTGINTWRWDVAWHNGMGYSVGDTVRHGTSISFRRLEDGTFALEGDVAVTVGLKGRTLGISTDGGKTWAALKSDTDGDLTTATVAAAHLLGPAGARLRVR